MNICRNCGVPVKRLERFIRYNLKLGSELTVGEKTHIYSLVHDRMTEQFYEKPLVTFEVDTKPEHVRIIDLISKGEEELRRINIELGLGMDEQDIKYYFDLFVNKMRRNPTAVELF